MCSNREHELIQCFFNCLPIDKGIWDLKACLDYSYHNARIWIFVFPFKQLSSRNSSWPKLFWEIAWFFSAEMGWKTFCMDTFGTISYGQVDYLSFKLSRFPLRRALKLEEAQKSVATWQFKGSSVCSKLQCDSLRKSSWSSFFFLFRLGRKKTVWILHQGPNGRFDFVSSNGLHSGEC